MKMSRDFIYILNINTDISSYYFPVIGQSTSDLTTGGVTMPADSGTSFLRSGLGVLFLTLAVPLLRLLR